MTETFDVGDLVIDYAGYVYIMLEAGDLGRLWDGLKQLDAGRSTHSNGHLSGIDGMTLLSCDDGSVAALGIEGWGLRKLS